MSSKCPSCGSPAREDEHQCPRCGWDFDVRQHHPKKSDAAARVAAPEPEAAEPPILDLDAGPPVPAEAPAARAEPPSKDPAPPLDLDAEQASLPSVASVAPPAERQEPENEAAESLVLPPTESSAPGTAPAASKRSFVVAAAAAAALGAGMLIVRSFMRPNAAPPAPAQSPQTPPETTPPPPAPAAEDVRPTASFAAAPHSIVLGEDPKPAPAPVASSAPAEPVKRNGPKWIFEGTVFDLLTARGVFGAELTFVDPAGEVVGKTETGADGRYRISIPAGAGYQLKISQSDYAGRYIDEGAATSSLRQATPEERRILLSAASRNRPWTGDPEKPERRDLALVPLVTEEP